MGRKVEEGGGKRGRGRSRGAWLEVNLNVGGGTVYKAPTYKTLAFLNTVHQVR